MSRLLVDTSYLISFAEDENTLAKYASRLRSSGLCAIRVLLLRNGFNTGQLKDPDQAEFDLGDGELR